jgi:hypothetical protein
MPLVAQNPNRRRSSAFQSTPDSLNMPNVAKKWCSLKKRGTVHPLQRVHNAGAELPKGAELPDNQFESGYYELN